MKRVYMHPLDAQNLTFLLECQSTLPEVILPKIERVIQRANLQGVPSLIQYLECNPVHRSDNENGFNLTVNGRLYRLTNHNNLLEYYRVKYRQERGHCFVNKTKVDADWLAGRAVQTRLADQGTIRIQQTVLGILVLPVFVQLRDCKQIVGIIELVTFKPKRSYEKDFFHIQELLMEERLVTEGMGKTIKVHSSDNIVKFSLNYSAKLQDLEMEVRMRFKEQLENKTFTIEYEDTNHKRYRILCDQDLKDCINKSVSKGTTLIRMFVR